MQPPPLYYLYNYRTLLAWVGERYGDLLTPAEQAFYHTFLTLPETSQALLVRMISRKGDLFRVSKLQYEELGACADALAPLLQIQWVEPNPELSLAAVFGVLTRPELTAWLGRFAGTKAQWLAAHEPHCPERLPWCAWFETLPGEARPIGQNSQTGAWVQDLIQLSIRPLHDIFQLLFFGNQRQSLAEFVLADLGVFRYQPVNFTEACRSFNAREDVDLYRELQAIKTQFDLDGDALRALSQLPARPEHSHGLARRFDRLCFSLAYALEQSGAGMQALPWYRLTRLPESRTRAIRVLENSGEKAAALAMLHQALLQPVSEAEQQQLVRMRPRLQRALRLTPERERPHELKPSLLRLAETEARVELNVAHHLHTLQPNAPVLWAENVLWTGLFGLIFWPAIFAAVPGAFFHPFQTGPNDLYHLGFAARRKEMIASCFTLLERADYVEVLVQRFDEKQGLQSPFVHWQWWDQATLTLALSCIPVDHLRKICERMLFDLTANRAGFPDLVQFYPAQKTYRLIEVKGPGDRLQDNQIRWLKFFREQGIQAEVIQVQWGVV